TESTLNHHRVNDRDGGRGERNTSNLRLVQRPAKNELSKEQYDSKWNGKRKNADKHARAPISLQRNGIDFRSSEKREHPTTKQCQEVGPLRRLQHVMELASVCTGAGNADMQRAALQSDSEIAGNHADQDFN